jgi:hypothetical protein
MIGVVACARARWLGRSADDAASLPGLDDVSATLCFTLLVLSAATLFFWFVDFPSSDPYYDEPLGLMWTVALARPCSRGQARTLNTKA